MKGPFILLFIALSDIILSIISRSYWGFDTYGLVAYASLGWIVAKKY